MTAIHWSLVFFKILVIKNIRATLSFYAEIEFTFAKIGREKVYFSSTVVYMRATVHNAHAGGLCTKNYLTLNIKFETCGTQLPQNAENYRMSL